MVAFKNYLTVAAFLSALILPPCQAETQSVKETMDAVVARLYDTLSEEELFSLNEDKIQSILTPEERESLATQHVTFEVNVPVVVSVMHHKDQPTLPFWLPESGFKKTEMTVANDENRVYDVWQKEFQPGPVQLGINGFDKHRQHYFVSVGPL
ncbi:MAG: metallophosphoesterase, partial [Candidatus Omnitrophica bacterium]|nr:metallophosphoesterase [Candidatus Omnitrophota bacterium]